ncbi:hypothetical protein POVCU2_0001410 [Plasmodium ovale curtisi]|uniref:GRAM domain-containing protein n=1 Tax=Plasmodium ovale curtisi TaxID=864141 RepID=A0A1A8VHR7_PLAOA|nr:hypothetical protein POVCU2_0001410 [Plasmodium ovale curtisi]
MFGDIKLILQNDELSKISCFNNVKERLCFSDCVCEPIATYTSFTKNIKHTISESLLSEKIISDISSKLQEDLEVYGRLANFDDGQDGGHRYNVQQSREVESVHGQGKRHMGGTQIRGEREERVEKKGYTENELYEWKGREPEEGKLKCTVDEKNCKKGGSIEIEQQSTKSFENSDFSFDDMNEDILNAIKKTHVRKKKSKLKSRNSDFLSSEQCAWMELGVAPSGEQVEANGKAVVDINGNARVDTNDKMDVVTDGKAGVDTNDKMDVVTDGKAGVETNDQMDVVTDGKAGVDTNDKMDVVTDGKVSVDTNDKMDVVIDDKASVDTNDKIDVVTDGKASVETNNPVRKDTRDHMRQEDEYTYIVSDKADMDAITRSCINSYSCALLKTILVQGKIFITHDSIYFISLFNSLFSKNSIMRLKYESIVSVEKMTVFHFIPNALKIVVKNRSFLFTSFVHRDHAYSLIMDMIQDNNNAREIPKKGTVISSDEQEEEEEEEEEEKEKEKEKEKEETGQGRKEDERKVREEEQQGGNAEENNQVHLLDVSSPSSFLIEPRKNTLEINPSKEEKKILEKNNYVQCSNHIGGLYINKNFKKIFLDIFSQFNDENPLVKNVHDKNPQNLCYDSLHNLGKLFEENIFLTYELKYNISLFDDDKKVFGIPSRSDVNENINFFFLNNGIIIQKYITLLCNIPLAGCFRTVITVTIHGLPSNAASQGSGNIGNSGSSGHAIHSTQIDFSYDIDFVKHTFFKSQIRGNALPELEASLAQLRKYTEAAITERYSKKGQIKKTEQHFVHTNELLVGEDSSNDASLSNEKKKNYMGRNAHPSAAKGKVESSSATAYMQPSGSKGSDPLVFFRFNFRFVPPALQHSIGKNAHRTTQRTEQRREFVQSFVVSMAMLLLYKLVIFLVKLERNLGTTNPVLLKSHKACS